MAYDVQLAQINVGVFGLTIANTYLGFPHGTDFHTLLMSYWMCGPLAISGSSSAAVWPGFNTAPLFTFEAGVDGILLTNISLGSLSSFYKGTWILASPGMRVHMMLSVDTHAQTVQVFANDQPVAVAGTWTGTPPFDFNLGPPAFLGNPSNSWNFDVADVIASGQYPALGDVWITNPASFVDLGITTNRRKFINADLTPVDLGNTGTGPFGSSPNIYMSIRPGGVATDILTNRGAGGGTWNFSGDTPPTIQASGACTLPIPPPPVAAPKLWLLRQPELHFIGTKVSDIGDTPGAPYRAKAVHFDGNQWLHINSLSCSDNQYLSFVMWFKASFDINGWDTENGTVFMIDAANNYSPELVLRQPTDPDFYQLSDLLVSDATFVDRIYQYSNDNVFSNGQWFCLMGTVDSTDLARAKLYRGDTDITNSASAYLSGTLGFNIACNGLTFHFMTDGYYALIPPALNTVADVADFRFMPGISLLDSGGDIPLATRRLFVDGAGKPVDPAIATAALGTPAILFTGNAADFTTNRGNGGVSSLGGTGSITDASTSPSD